MGGATGLVGHGGGYWTCQAWGVLLDLSGMGGGYWTCQAWGGYWTCQAWGAPELVRHAWVLGLGGGGGGKYLGLAT